MHAIGGYTPQESAVLHVESPTLYYFVDFVTDLLDAYKYTYRYSSVLTHLRPFEKLPLTTIRNPLIMRLTSPMLQNRITTTSTSIKIARPATPVTHPADPNVRSLSVVFANKETVWPSRLRVPNATAAATSAGRAAT